MDNKTSDTDAIDVEYVAHLARIHLNAEEIRKFQAQLEHIVEYVRKIQELDTSGVEPTSHAIVVQNVLRDDANRESLDPDDVMRNAPRHRDGQFVVPKILQ